MKRSIQQQQQVDDEAGKGGKELVREQTDKFNLMGNVDYSWVIKKKKHGKSERDSLLDSEDSMLDKKTVAHR